MFPNEVGLIGTIPSFVCFFFLFHLIMDIGYGCEKKNSNFLKNSKTVISVENPEFF